MWSVRDRLSGDAAALKLLFPQGGDAQLERLRRELRIVRGLEHPGIVRIHDIGEHGGLLYVLMPLLRGETLKERLARGRPGTAERGAIMDGILEALRAAHERGVVHRDIKPANVFLAADGTGPARVVLLDFGLARDEDLPGLTRTGQFVGTPEYVAPEQARGDREVGPAADVYGAGVILWEMFTGAPPFAADSSMGVLMAHLSRPLPKLARSAAPAWERDLAARMLEKDAGRRPADAGAALARLRRQRRDPWLVRVPRALRSRRALTATLLVLLLALLSVVAFAPARLERTAEGVRVTSLAGLTIHEPKFPRIVMDAVTEREGPFARRALILFKGTTSPRLPFPEEAPLGLAVLDTWSGQWSAWSSREASVMSSLEGLHTRYDRVSNGGFLARTPWHDEDGRRLFLAVVRHVEDYPNAILTVTLDGDAQQIVYHPGNISGPPLFVDTGTEFGTIAVLTGVNSLAGRREIVLGIPSPVKRYAGLMITPPFDQMYAGIQTMQPFYYTFLPAAGEPRLDRHGNSVVVTVSHEKSYEIDLATGVPVGASLENCAPEAWRENQGDLLKLLRTASQTHDPESVTRELREFASRPSITSSHRGVALARAAELLRQSGRPDEALPVAEEALATEPLIPGHLRLVIDLCSQTGRWREVERRLAQADPEARSIPEVLRDRFVGDMLAGAWDAARVDTDEMFHSNTFYAHLQSAMLALHEGDAARAHTFAGETAESGSFPEFAFLDALALALQGGPALAESARRLAVAERAAARGRCCRSRRCARTSPRTAWARRPTPPTSTRRCAKSARRRARTSSIACGCRGARRSSRQRAPAWRSRRRQRARAELRIAARTAYISVSRPRATSSTLGTTGMSGSRPASGRSPSGNCPMSGTSTSIPECGRRRKKNAPPLIPRWFPPVVWPTSVPSPFCLTV